MPTHRCVVEEFPTDSEWYPHVRSYVWVTCLETGEVCTGAGRGPLTAERIGEVRNNLYHWCRARHVLGTP